jgi:hypothetical protein
MTYETNPNTKTEIDKLLAELSHHECHLGIDSTPEEVSACKEKQRLIFDKIKALDVEFYEVVKPYEAKEPEQHTVVGC